MVDAKQQTEKNKNNENDTFYGGYGVVPTNTIPAKNWLPSKSSVSKIQIRQLEKTEICYETKTFTWLLVIELGTSGSVDCDNLLIIKAFNRNELKMFLCLMIHKSLSFVKRMSFQTFIDISYQTFHWHFINDSDSKIINSIFYSYFGFSFEMNVYY